MRVLHPSIGVLYTSGYTDDTIVRHGVVAEGVAFQEKPYSPADLSAKVCTMLNAASA